jgi:hypothetical protein
MGWITSLSPSPVHGATSTLTISGFPCDTWSAKCEVDGTAFWNVGAQRYTGSFAIPFPADSKCKAFVVHIYCDEAPNNHVDIAGYVA